MDVDRTRRNRRRRRSELQRPTADRKHVRLGHVSILGLSATRLPEFILSACAVPRSVSQPQQLKKCVDHEMAYVEAQGSKCSHPQSAPCPLALGTCQQTPNLLSLSNPPHPQRHISTAQTTRIQYSRGQLLNNLREDSEEMVAAEPDPAMCAPTSGESVRLRAGQGICSY